MRSFLLLSISFILFLINFKRLKISYHIFLTLIPCLARLHRNKHVRYIQRWLWNFLPQKGVRAACSRVIALLKRYERQEIVIAIIRDFIQDHCLQIIEAMICTEDEIWNIEAEWWKSMYAQRACRLTHD